MVKFDGLNTLGMSYKTEDGKYRKPKEIDPPPISEIIKNPEFWKNRTMNYLGDERYFDQEIRTGKCYFCTRQGDAQKTAKTNLHHLKYDHSDPLAWTIEVCTKCHWQVDLNNREAIARTTGKVIERRYGKYDSPYYENREEKMKREERDREDWYMKYCMNLDGKFEPMKELIPDKETYDKVIEAIKKASSKRNTMSDVSRRYLTPETEETES